MYSKYGGKLKRWLTTGRIVALVVALVGLGLLAGGATGTLASRETDAGQAAAADPAPEPTAAESTDRPEPQVATLSEPTPPPPPATATTETTIALAPRPDLERPARRLAASVTAPTTGQPSAATNADGERSSHDDAWQRHAAKSPVIDGPMIAIVIDDTGHDMARTKRLAAFPDGVLTLAFLPYVEDLAAQTEIGRAAGHEILLHLPMEPLNPEVDTGPNVLTINLDPATMEERLQWNLARLEGYVGVNNHMGSRFTADRPAMAKLMKKLHDRGLLFLDSRTTTATVGRETAAAANVPFLSRDVFLDNESTENHVAAQLALTEKRAAKQGYAIAIGHPHPWTLAALENWAPGARERGFVLVPLTAIKKHQQHDVAQRSVRKDGG